MTKFVEVQRYFELPLAELAKSRLENENVYCFLQNKYHASIKWQIANALGGIRVLVKSEEFVKAKEILERDDSVYLENIKFPPPEDEDVCKNCGSDNLKGVSLRAYSCALMILTGLPLIFWGKYYKCQDCGCKN